MRFRKRHVSELSPHPRRAPEFNYLKQKSSRNRFSIQMEWICRSFECSLFHAELLQSDAEHLPHEFEPQIRQSYSCNPSEKQN